MQEAFWKQAAFVAIVSWAYLLSLSGLMPNMISDAFLLFCYKIISLTDDSYLCKTTFEGFRAFCRVYDA